MSPSEIAFLALGIVLGAAIGAAIVEAVRSRPAPRREVRVTIAPNSVLPRRSSDPGRRGRRRRLGSPDAGLARGRGVARGPAATFLPRRPLGARRPSRDGDPRSNARAIRPAGPAVDRGGGAGGSPGAARPGIRTAPAPATPATPARGPGRRGGGVPARPLRPGPASRARPAPGPGPGTRAPPRSSLARRPARRHPAGPSASRGRRSARSRCSRRWPRRDGHPDAVGPLDEPRSIDRCDGESPVATSLDIGAPVPTRAVKPRAPADLAPIVIAPAVDRVRHRGGGRDGLSRTVEDRAAGGGGTADGCRRRRVGARARHRPLRDEPGPHGGAMRRGVDRGRPGRRPPPKRCARPSARTTPCASASSAPRPTPTRGRSPPPRTRLHKEFRAATRRARGAEDTEAAAREWLTQINELNVKRPRRPAARGRRRRRAARRPAAARADGRRGRRGTDQRRERRGRLPGRPRAARRLRGGRGQAAGGRRGRVAPADVRARWRRRRSRRSTSDAEIASSFERQVPSTQAAIVGMPVIVKVLRGDRAARDRLVATLATGEPDGERLWTAADRAARRRDHGPGDRGRLPRHARGRHLLVAVHGAASRARSSARCPRSAIAMTAPAGSPTSGSPPSATCRSRWATRASTGCGSATGRASGSSPSCTSARAWPSDEWLVEHADDLTLGQMVEALGPRAGDLAEVWNAWGRVRPALLEPD